MGKRFVSRLILLSISPLCIWQQADRTWWWKRFKNGNF